VKTVPLGELVDILDNLRVPVNSTERASRLGSIPYYGATGQVGTIDQAIFDETLILLGEDGVPFLDPTKHKAYEISGPSWVNNHAHVIRARPELINQRYLLHFLNSFNYSGYVNGATRLKLTQGDMRRIPVPLPTLEKQSKIAMKLDSAFAEIDLSYQKTTDSLNNLSSCFDSFLDNILKNQISEFGLKKLVEVLDIARGGSPRPINSYLTNGEDGVNWIKISDATSSKKYITQTSQKIKPEGVTRSRLVNPGDFLLSNSMSFGKPYIMATTGCIHDGWLVLSNNKKLLNQDYLYYVLGSKYIYDQFNRSAAGSTVRNLNISLAGQVTFPVPDLETQEALVTRLMDFEKSIDELKISMAIKLTKLLELKDSILSSAFDLNASTEVVA
jgi:type I restriction enzyme, S subunit